MSLTAFIRSRTLPQLAGIAMIGAGATAFVYQATKNAVSAARYSEGWMKWVDAAGGVAVELFVAAAAIGIISLSQRGKLTSRRSLAGLMVVCVTFGVFAASQQISSGRAVHSAEVSVNTDNHAGRKADLEAFRSEHAGMAKVPTVEAASAELMKLKARKGWSETNGCANPAAFPVLCKQVAATVAIMGTAQRKSDLEKKIAELSKANTAVTGAHIATADPIAAKMAKWFDISTDDAQVAVAFFSAVTMMLLAMFGTHFGLLVYGMEHDGTVAKPTADVLPFAANDRHTVIVEKHMQPADTSTADKLKAFQQAFANVGPMKKAG